jgi:hypothetical protein
MKNTLNIILICCHQFYDAAGFRCVFKAVKMSLSELQRRNFKVKFCLENPNKSKSETFEYLKLLGYKKPTIYSIT